MREAHQAGTLNETQQLVMRDARPKEELYDIRNDPYEINNLADDPAYLEKLKELRGRLATWLEETDDKGRQAESAEMFDSDMAVYLNTIKKKRPGRSEIIAKNIALMRKWREEGK